MVLIFTSLMTKRCGVVVGWDIITPVRVSSLEWSLILTWSFRVS